MILSDKWVYQSRLLSVNPSLKCLFAAAAMLICLAVNSMQLWIGAVVSVILILWLVGKTPLYVIFKLMAVPAVFLLLSCTVAAFSWSADGNGFPVLVTKESMQHGVSLFFKAYSVVSCMCFISLTTTVPEFIEVLKGLKVPEVVIELMYLIYRYLFVLLERLNHMNTAADSRLGYQGIRGSFYTFAHLSGNLLVASFRQSSRCFDAMESRGYQGRLEFLTEKKQCRFSHVLAGVLYLLCLGLLAWYVS